MTKFKPKKIHQLKYPSEKINEEVDNIQDALRSACYNANVWLSFMQFIKSVYILLIKWAY